MIFTWRRPIIEKKRHKARRFYVLVFLAGVRLASGIVHTAFEGEGEGEGAEGGVGVGVGVGVEVGVQAGGGGAGVGVGIAVGIAVAS